MSKKKKVFKFRENVKAYVDADYKNGVEPINNQAERIRGLNKEELKWYENFENEYYSNALRNKDSIHRKNLSEEDFKRAVNETYSMTNAQNRDAYAISSCSNIYLQFIDDQDTFTQLEGDNSRVNTVDDPKRAMDRLIREAEDEILSECGREVSMILFELAYEATKIGYSLRPDRVNKTLKKRKENDKK